MSFPFILVISIRVKRLQSALGSQDTSRHKQQSTKATRSPFVIPTGAKRSGGICSVPQPSTNPKTLHATSSNQRKQHTLNLSSRPERSEAEGSAVCPNPQQIPKHFTPQAAINAGNTLSICHPDRSEAKRRDLQCALAPKQIPKHFKPLAAINEGNTLSICHPDRSEAKRRDLQCALAPKQIPKHFTPLAAINESPV
jgi:hypothetical protein